MQPAGRLALKSSTARTSPKLLLTCSITRASLFMVSRFVERLEKRSAAGERNRIIITRPPDIANDFSARRLCIIDVSGSEKDLNIFRRFSKMVDLLRYC